MKLYCVYLTIYSGDKMPQLYIGSSSIDKINNGYRGSVSSKKYKSIWIEQLKISPALFETKILKTFNIRKDATFYENQIQHELNVVESENYINMWYASPNGFKGYDSSGENNPNYGKKCSRETKQKISEFNKGRKLSDENRKNMSKSAVNRRKENSWNQIKDKPMFERFDSYEHFGIEIMNLYEKCYKIPLLISEQMSVTEGSIKTYLRHNNKEFISNANWTKIIRNYGGRWKNIQEYEQNIISLHKIGLSPSQIAEELKINSWGVYSSLKRNNISPHKGKPGPIPHS